MARLGTQEILRRIREIHGDDIDFSLIDRKINLLTVDRIDLICTICSHKWSPLIRSVLNNHSGCPSCARNSKMSLDDFIARAELIHGASYDYSLNETFNYKKNVTIRCRICKETWFTRPSTHFQPGNRCPHCRKRKTCELCQTVWTKGRRCPNCWKEKICLVCKKSWYRPGECPYCKGGKPPKTLNDFLIAACRLHQEKYDYNEVEDLKGKITVQCRNCKHNIRTTVLEHLSTDFECPFC